MSVEEIDPIFNYLAFYKRQFYVLRTLPNNDKEFAEIIESDNTIYPKSNAHRLFFNNVWNINILKDKWFDDSEQITFIRFKTKKYGWEINDKVQD